MPSTKDNNKIAVLACVCLALLLAVMILLSMVILQNSERSLLYMEAKTAAERRVWAEKDYTYILEQYQRLLAERRDTPMVIEYKMTPEAARTIHEAWEKQRKIDTARELNRRMAEALK